MKFFILLSGVIAVTCASPTINSKNIARDSARKDCGKSIIQQGDDKSTNTRPVYASVRDNKNLDPLLKIFPLPKCDDLKDDMMWNVFKNTFCSECKVFK